MEDKKTIVVCLSRFPYPLEKGDKLRAFHQIKTLSEHYNVVLICTSDLPISEEHLNQLDAFCSEVHVFQLTKFGLLFTLLTYFFSKKPFQVQYFFRFSIRRKINGLLNRIRPDAIYCQLIRTTEYVKHYHDCPKTIDYMDALSKGMERRIHTEPTYKRFFYRIESRRLINYERSVFDYFEHHTIISDQDRQYIHHPKKARITIVPNGVEHRFFEPLNIEKQYDLLFTGNFSYVPNVSAAVYLATEILPELKKRGITLNLLLAGASPSAAVLALRSSQVTVTGWVPDIRESYQSARIFVAPLFMGTGLQNKLLEAMASGLPCITTPLVNNALGGIEGQNILLAEDLNGFVEIIVRYLTDSSTFVAIANKGQQFVEKDYSWERQNYKLLSLLP